MNLNKVKINNNQTSDKMLEIQKNKLTSNEGQL